MKVENNILVSELGPQEDFVRTFYTEGSYFLDFIEFYGQFKYYTAINQKALYEVELGVGIERVTDTTLRNGIRITVPGSETIKWKGSIQFDIKGRKVSDGSVLGPLYIERIDIIQNVTKAWVTDQS